jgi:hypothetical protein
MIDVYTSASTANGDATSSGDNRPHKEFKGKVSGPGDHQKPRLKHRARAEILIGIACMKRH